MTRPKELPLHLLLSQGVYCLHQQVVQSFPQGGDMRVSGIDQYIALQIVHIFEQVRRIAMDMTKYISIWNYNIQSTTTNIMLQLVM
jgi:hypothetical protein